MLSNIPTGMSSVSNLFYQDHPGEKAANSLTALKSLVGGLWMFIESIGRKGVRWSLAFLTISCLFAPGVILFLLTIRRVKMATRELHKQQLKLDERIKTARVALSLGQDVYEALKFDQLTPQDYARLKRAQENWIQVEAQLSKQEAEINDVAKEQAHGYSVSKGRLVFAKFVLWLLTPFLKFYLAYRSYNRALTEVLSIFDASSKDGQYFKKISEQELWESRSQLYDYLI